uniref:Myb/SANT-like DNA-binding domain-containing protein n=1 Tax=Aegilops tauschii subsp. strangulata TaxID=200361 RepID=A0A453E8B4_AEGTS
MERVDGGAGLGARGSAGAMLGMEMHLVHQPQPQIHAASSFQQPPEHLHHANGGFQVQHHQAMPMGQQHPPPSYGAYVAPPSRAVNAHEEEEMGNGIGAVQQPGAGAAGCSWSRMKWTDAMVRLLIAVVYNAGEDGEGVSAGGKAAASHSHGKAVASAAAQGGHGPQAAAQQRKGKWRSVSRAMVEKGFKVSPQQCEDKFNDLNKRYKGVVDLLGRGTACDVVANPALLDTMGELTAKSKEEARKMLRSKRLFFREMCNYHNPGGTATASHGIEGGAAANSSAGRQVVAMVNSSTRSEDDSEDDVLSSKEAEEEEDDYDLDDVEEKAPGGHKNKRRLGESSAAAAGEDGEENGNNKPARGRPCTSMQQLKRELAAAEAGGDQQQLRQLVQRRALELEKQELAYEVQELALEKHRRRWEQFKAKKEWNIEQERQRIEGLRVDGKRMLLMLKQKEFDLDHLPGAQTPPPGAAFQQQPGSSPSTTGQPN